MNIIRTKAVELTVIPAIAYKQKLTSGGAGIKILRLDENKSAVYTIDKRTGEPIPYGPIDENFFPAEAFDEALEMTNGLPYSGRSNIRLSAPLQAEPEDVPAAETPAEIDVSSSPEYRAIVERYSDEKGKLNYQLMNKNFIQFASKSKVVGDMVRSRARQEDILRFIIRSRATMLANIKENLDDRYVDRLIETLDEIDPRSAFKELKAYINRLLSRQGKG